MTGLSRSGTKYAAKLWSELGYRCGHEAVFNIFKVQDPSLPAQGFAGPTEKDGDSSFLAAPMLSGLPADCVIFHQIRDPLEVIRSHLGIRFFAEPSVPSIYLADNHHDFVEYIERFCPEVGAERTEVERCMRYWVSWNRLIADAGRERPTRYLRYRVEDFDVELVTSMAALFGDALDPRAVERALASVGRRTNSRPRDESADWATLPEGRAKADLLEAANAFGYAPTGSR